MQIRRILYVDTTRHFVQFIQIHIFARKGVSSVLDCYQKRGLFTAVQLVLPTLKIWYIISFQQN